MSIGGPSPYFRNQNTFNTPTTVGAAGSAAGAAPNPQVGVMELLGPHTVQVANVLQDGGVAPNDLTLLGLQNPASNAGTVRDYVALSLAEPVNEVSGNLEGLASNPNNDVRVVNVSYGTSRAQVYDGVLRAYLNNPDFRQQVQGELGINPNSDYNQQAQQVINFIDQTAANDPRVQASMNRYQNATQQAANNGISVVVAAMNAEQNLREGRASGLNISQGAGFNVLGMSDNVISVGATDNNGTAALGDDSLANFSSLGNGRFGPTVAANGVNVQGNDGTSFAVPQVSAAVANIMQANPNLTPQQIQVILQSTAFDNPNISSAGEGAGTVNPNGALQQASLLNNNPLGQTGFFLA